MIKKFTAAAAAAVLVLAGPVAHAASPAGQEIARVPQAKLLVARRNVEVITSAVQRTTALTGVLNDPRLQNAATADEYIAAIRVMTPEIEAGRAQLKAIAAEIEALPRISAEGDPDQLRVIDKMTADVVLSIERMDGLLGSVTDLGAALDAGDVEAAERALARLSEGMMLTIDGQAAMLRARTVFADPQSSAYAQAMTLACIYESFAAVTRGELEYLPVPEAASTSEAALDCARAQIAAGREAMVREEGARSSVPSTRAMQVRMSEIGGQLLDEMERARESLSSATAVMKAGGDFDAIEAELDKFEAAEQALSRLASEQMAAATGG